ncbi:MAG: signal recognition particle-docking protein FtsY, partial [Actinobacteria bacterium]|nr:signal recognition particle-docking protein FtsY [Actinomycetota bacterium]
MELLIVLLLVVLILGVGVGVLVTRRRSDLLEPPSTLDETVAVEAEVETAVEAEAEVEAKTVPEEVETAVEVEVVEKPRFRDRLSKARSAFSGAVGSIAGRSRIDEQTWDELEEALIMADVGVGAAQDLLEHLRTR